MQTSTTTGPLMAPVSLPPGHSRNRAIAARWHCPAARRSSLRRLRLGEHRDQKNDGTQQQHGAGKARAGLQQKRPHTVSPARSHMAKMLRRLRARSWLTATRMRSGRSAGSSTGPEPGQCGSEIAQRLPLLHTLLARLEVCVHLLHFPPRQPAVEIIRQPPCT
jgi:hypothetical protein